MRLLSMTFMLILSPVTLVAQKLPTWERVYTFDNSVIEMNTSEFIFGGDIARATFLWTFQEPEVLSDRLKYKSTQEVIEFNCVHQLYRPYEITFIDAAGKAIGKKEGHPPSRWLPINGGGMIERLFTPACQLFRARTRLPLSNEEIERKKLAQLVWLLLQRLEQAKDFTPIIQKFFAGDYLERYLSDKKTNWFFNLNRDIAARASRAELQRFYIAQMNASYLSCVFFISQSSYVDQGVREEDLLPGDIGEMIEHHPYTAKYRIKPDNYDYIGENIDSIERLRSYTDLLENIGSSFRKRVINSGSERSAEYKDLFDSYESGEWICKTECLGLPKGTKLFQIYLPPFHLQIANIKGQLRIVSVTS